jgi:hypothetical protein
MFKIRWNKENTTAAIYACAVLALTLTGICIIVNIDAIYYAVRSFFHTISPLIYGLALAYLINSLLKFCERRLVSRLKTKKMVPMLRRMLSLVITYAFLALFIFLIGLLVIPQIVRNYEVIVTNTSAFISRMIERVASILGSHFRNTGRTDAFGDECGITNWSAIHLVMRIHIPCHGNAKNHGSYIMAFAITPLLSDICQPSARRIFNHICMEIIRRTCSNPRTSSSIHQSV